MAQNRSNAVMASRIEPPDSLDFFPTPPWATRALCEFLQRREPIADQTVWDPACGECDMILPLGEYFAGTLATDVFDYQKPAQFAICDFLIKQVHPQAAAMGLIDWVATNPPFRLAKEFIEMALKVANIGVAVLVRTSFLEGQDRHNGLFSKLPPAMILQFAERVPMFKGRLDPKGSTATSYCWLIWMVRGSNATEFQTIAPCRSRLERAGDYPAIKQQPGAGPLFHEPKLPTFVVKLLVTFEDEYEVEASNAGEAEGLALAMHDSRETSPSTAVVVSAEKIREAR